MSIFIPLFSISTEHGFFKDGKCACLEFVATNKTQRIIDNAGLLLRKTADGISLAYDKLKSEALQQFAEDPDDELYFEFKVYSHSPEFKSYTYPFSGSIQQALFFCNEHLNQSDEPRIRLHADQYAAPQDLAPLDSIKFKGILNQKDQFIPPVFVIRISAKGEHGIFIDEQVEPTVQNFYISFKPRQTTWKFFLLGEMVQKNAYIYDADEKVEFESAGKVTLEGQRIAKVFKSKQNIPLNEKYSLHFQLKEKAPEGEKILIDRLPVACLDHVGKEVVAEEETVVSEIYVNSSL